MLMCLRRKVVTIRRCAGCAVARTVPGVMKHPAASVRPSSAWDCWLAIMHCWLLLSQQMVRKRIHPQGVRSIVVSVIIVFLSWLSVPGGRFGCGSPRRIAVQAQS